MNKNYSTIQTEEERTLLINPIYTEGVFSRGGSGGFFTRTRRYILALILVLIVLGILIPILVIWTKSLQKDEQNNTASTKLACISSSSGGPTSNPITDYYGPNEPIPDWLNNFGWDCVYNIIDFPGLTDNDRFDAAQNAAIRNGGGVLYFPEGTYTFVQNIEIADNVIVRGQVGTSLGVGEIQDLRTVFMFPDRRHMGFLNINGSSNIGIVNIWSKNGAIMFWPDLETTDTTVNLKGYWFDAYGVNSVGENRTVFGCVVQSVTYQWPDPEKPLSGNMWPWRFSTAISVYAESNIFIALNSILFTPNSTFNVSVFFSGPNQFKGTIPYPYDDRYGIDVNKILYGQIVSKLLDNGTCNGLITPDCFPYYFASGITIRDNYIESTGKTAIIWSGSGIDEPGSGPTIFNNVINFQPNVTCYSLDGNSTCVGNSSNNNRGLDQSGYASNVNYNTAVVYRQTQLDGNPTSDGEGIIQSSVNGNNGYLSVWINNVFTGGDLGSAIFSDLESVIDCTITGNGVNSFAEIGAIWQGNHTVSGNQCIHNAIPCIGMT